MFVTLGQLYQLALYQGFLAGRPAFTLTPATVAVPQ